MVEGGGNRNQQSAGEPLPAETSSFEQINLLCEAFSKEFDSGLRPTIDHYLAQVSQDDQPTLLRNFLRIEIEHRRAAGEQPHVDEYLERFPEFATLVRQAFWELSTMSMLQAGYDTPGAKTKKFKTPAANRLGHYQLIRELGRGGMGTVYEEGLVDTYHDRIRETVLGNMQGGQQRTIHLALAKVIETDVGGVSDEVIAQLEEGTLDTQQLPASHRVFDLSFHFDAAGEKRQACVYAFLAAEQAQRQFALEVAATQYALALKNSEHLQAAARRRIQVTFGRS